MCGNPQPEAIGQPEHALLFFQSNHCKRASRRTGHATEQLTHNVHPYSLNFAALSMSVSRYVHTS